MAEELPFNDHIKTFKEWSKSKMYYCPKCDKEHHDILCPFCDSNLKNVEIKDCPIEIANDIWNAAIEDAAKCVEQANRDGPYQAIISHREIRKLKK